MEKILLLPLLILLTLPVGVLGHTQVSERYECSEKNDALLEKAIDSLTKAYQFDPDDPVTKYYLMSAYMQQYACISLAYLAIPEGKRNSPEARKLLERVDKIYEVLTELDHDIRDYIDPPPAAPDGRKKEPAAVKRSAHRDANASSVTSTSKNTSTVLTTTGSN